VAAPPFDGPPACGFRRRELRKVRHRGGSLVHIPGTQHGAHPAIQLVIVKLSQRVVLAEQGDQLFAVGITGQPPRAAGR
jgi:acetolactate synthase regulatory subunit